MYADRKVIKIRQFENEQKKIVYKTIVEAESYIFTDRSTA